MNDFPLPFYGQQYATGEERNEFPGSQRLNEMTTSAPQTHLRSEYNSVSHYDEHRASTGPLTPHNSDHMTTAVVPDAEIGSVSYAGQPGNAWEQAEVPVIGAEHVHCVPPGSLELSPSPSWQSTSTSAVGYSHSHTSNANLSGDEQPPYIQAGHDYHALQRLPFHEQPMETYPGYSMNDDGQPAYQQWARSPHDGFQALPDSAYAQDDDHTPGLTRDVSLAMSRDNSHDKRNVHPSPAAVHNHVQTRHRPTHKRRTSSNSAKSNILRRTTSKEAENVDKAFKCPLIYYGCASSFKNKNEWKRHINKQHMDLDRWVCDQCNPDERRGTSKYFNRKDLFISHVRRMHPFDEKKTRKQSKTSPHKHAKNPVDREKHAMNEAAARCYVQTRSAPDNSGCLFCDEVFRGSHLWNTRLEHVGQHMEERKRNELPPVNPREWRADEDMHMWLVHHEVVVQDGNDWKIPK